MKRAILAVIAIASFITVFSQGKSLLVSHEGFYLSVAGGPVFGNIRRDDNTGKYYTVKGEATGFEPNLILRATFKNNAFFGPKINGVKKNLDYIFQEWFYVAGLTKYTTHNFFLTGNEGAAFCNWNSNRFGIYFQASLCKSKS